MLHISELPLAYQSLWDKTIRAGSQQGDYSAFLFYFHLLGQCTVRFDDSFEAYAGIAVEDTKIHLVLSTNKENNFFSLPIQHRLGVLKHELLHYVYLHFLRRGDKDPERFNIAADCAINQQIDKSWLPKGCVTPESLSATYNIQVLPGKSTEYYYDLLEGMPSSSEDSPTSLNLPGSHEKWQDKTADDVAYWATLIDMQVAEAAKEAGNVGVLPKEIQALFKRLLAHTSLDWRSLLRQLVSNTKVKPKKTILKSDRRLPDAEWIKGKTKEHIVNVLVIGDESGSVSDSQLHRGIQEILGVCKIVRTPVLYIPVDSSAGEPTELKKNTTTFSRTRRGGTYLYAAIKKMQEKRLKADVLIVITDGELTEADRKKMEELKIPVIWLITDKKVYRTQYASTKRAFYLSDK